MGPSGAALFSRYAFPPNELGHCGPPGADVLLAGGSASEGLDDDELRSRAARFNGAWPYLELLAHELGIADPLAPGVVATYWTGGPDLDRVPAASFADLVSTAFGGQPGVLARLAQAPGLLSSGPSHAFHVFVVYPWVGLLGTGGDVARAVLDQCMVRWGTVDWVDGEQAGVMSAPLTWDGGKLGLGPQRLETRRWSRDGSAFVSDLQPGDQVSLHWDWICDRLGGDAMAELANRTAQQLDSVNQWLAR